MKVGKNIEKVIRKLDLSLDINTKTDEAVLSKLLRAQEKTKQTKLAAIRPDIWRIIMNKPITKLATAAAVILIAVLAITFLDKAVTPAWAIEDTIKALENIYSIKISGNAVDSSTQSKGKYVLWALPNEDSTESAETRFEIPEHQISVVTKAGITYTHLFEENTVYIAERKNIVINPWLGSKFFHVIKKLAENWEISYGKDEKTGRDSIFAKCIYVPKSKSWWFQFDAETKMPVSFKQWENINFTGKPQFYAERIEYNPELPAGIFEFKIPEGAKVVKLQQKLPEYLNDPNCGILVEGLSDEEACLMIVEDYLRALIDGDWEYLAQLRPICNAENWELKHKRNEDWPIEILEIGQPSHEKGCSIGPVVPYTVKYSDGQIKNIKLIVKIRNIDGSKSCVIAGTYGGTKDFER
ncbi:MAG: hypothetical protein ABIG61_06140 [Planctomycetota bacterium]